MHLVKIYRQKTTRGADSFPPQRLGRVKKDAKPVFKKARLVPFSLKEAVEKELDRLTKDGIMTPMMHSEWASPIVVVPKTDGRVRICVDYKVSVNPVLDVDQYPFPNIGLTLKILQHFLVVFISANWTCPMHINS